MNNFNIYKIIIQMKFKIIMQKNGGCYISKNILILNKSHKTSINGYYSKYINNVNKMIKIVSLKKKKMLINLYKINIK